MEHRSAARVKTLKGGRIIFNRGPDISCIIRNLSETGASLEVKSQRGIPDAFWLMINRELTKRDCRVMWRGVNRMGVSFVEKLPSSRSG